MGDAEQCNSKNQKDLIAKTIIENFSKYAKKPSNSVPSDRTCTARNNMSLGKLTSCFSDWSPPPPRSRCLPGNLVQSRTNVACTTGSYYKLADSRPTSSTNGYSSASRCRQSCFSSVPAPNESRFSVSTSGSSPEPVFEDRKLTCYRQQGSLPCFRGTQGGASKRKLGSDDFYRMEDEGCVLGDTRKVADLCCELESDNGVFPPFRSLPGKEMQSSRGDLQRLEYCGKQFSKDFGKDSFLRPTRDPPQRPTDCCGLNGRDSMSHSEPFSPKGQDSGFPPDSLRPINTDFLTDSLEHQDDNSSFVPDSWRCIGKANGIPSDSFNSGLASPFALESCRPKVASCPVSPDFSKPNRDTSHFPLDDFELNSGLSSRFSLNSARHDEGSSQFVPNSFRPNGTYSSSPTDTTKSVCETSYDPCKFSGSSSNFSPESFVPNGAGPPFSSSSFKSTDKPQNFHSDLFSPNAEDSRFSQSFTCIDKASNFSSNAYRPNVERFSCESLRSSDKTSNCLSSSFRPTIGGSKFPVVPCGTTACNENSGALNCCVANDCCDLKEDWEDPPCPVNICSIGLDEWFAVSPSLQKTVAKLASKSVKKGGSVLKDLVRLKAANILPPDFQIPGEEQATTKCGDQDTEATASQLKLAAEKLVEHIVCRAAKLEAARNDKNVDLSECDCYLEDVVTKLSSIISDTTDQKKVSRASASESQRTSKANSSKSSSSSSSTSSTSSTSSSVNSSSNNSALKNRYQLHDCICDALMQNCRALLDTDPSILEALKDSPDKHCATMTFTAPGQTWRNINNSQGGHKRTGTAEIYSASSGATDAAPTDKANPQASVADTEQQIEDNGSEQSSEEAEEDTDDDQLTEPDDKIESNNRNAVTVNGLTKTSSENLPPTTFLELPPGQQLKNAHRKSVDAAILRMLESCLEDCSKLADSAELRSFVMEVVYGLYSTVRSKLETILKQQADDASPGSPSQQNEELLGKADQEIRELVLPTVIEHIVWLVRQDAKQRGGQVDRDAAKSLAGQYVDTIVTNAVLKLETDGKIKRPFAKTFVVTSNDAKVKRHAPLAAACKK